MSYLLLFLACLVLNIYIALLKKYDIEKWQWFFIALIIGVYNWLNYKAFRGLDYFKAYYIGMGFNVILSLVLGVLFLNQRMNFNGLFGLILVIIGAVLISK